MKKSLKVVLVTMFVMFLMLNISVFAADNDVTITASKTSVDVGEEFTVTLSQQSINGVSGIVAILDYDTTVFELVGTPQLAKDWSNLSDKNTEINLKISGQTEQSSGEIKTLNCIAKRSATREIKLANISLYDTAVNEIKLADKSISMNVEGESGDNDDIQLAGLQITKVPNTIEYTEGQKFDPTGIEIKAVYTNEETEVITDYTYSPNGALTTENNSITFSYNGKTVTQPINVKAVIKNDDNVDKNDDRNNNPQNPDETTSKSALPATGAKTIYILAIAVAFCGIGIVSYMGYKKYKGI